MFSKFRLYLTLNNKTNLIYIVWCDLIVILVNELCEECRIEFHACLLIYRITTIHA